MISDRPSHLVCNANIHACHLMLSPVAEVGLMCLVNSWCVCQLLGAELQIETLHRKCKSIWGWVSRMLLGLRGFSLCAGSKAAGTGHVAKSACRVFWRTTNTGS